MEIQRAKNRNLTPGDRAKSFQCVTLQVFIQLAAACSVYGKINAAVLPFQSLHLAADVIHRRPGAFPAHHGTRTKITVIGQQIYGQRRFSSLPNRFQCAAQIRICAAKTRLDLITRNPSFR